MASLTFNFTVNHLIPLLGGLEVCFPTELGAARLPVWVPKGQHPCHTGC